ncbi:DNA polymerase III subunit epsilon [Pelistega europaea]|uniref:DNA polymerase III subunit epsilon n=1 Tax=Pelistega europaea TaxID=106147 RepID=A0A7Y4LAP3_9BURK|nr:DNA polymerase III subunit epsilon [Pelistega europaea]NOL49988.1 DNA polymerase III subunit epsilon [Pelistega europaea]
MAIRQIVLDTETTGIDISLGNRIIELGCVEMINRELTGNNLHLYFNPDRDSEEEALRVHGLTTEFLSQHNRFADEVQQIVDYLSGAELIIHNAKFDVGFLNHELSLLNRPPLETFVSGVIDTLELARQQFPGKKNNLDALCSRFNISNEHRVLHGALLDAELLADVYIAMTRGQFGLGLEEVEEEHQTTVSQQISALSYVDLPVIYADAQELEAHDAYVKVLEKASGGPTLWRPEAVEQAS